MATIQIADNDARVQYTQAVTADTTQLTIDYPFFDLDDINVIVTNAAGTDTVLSRGTGTGTFAVVGTSVDDGFSGGHVTLGDTYSDAATKYTIFRNIAVERTTDFPTSGPFNVSSLNTELDRIFAIEQELETAITRTLTLPESDGIVSTTLPNIDTRKGKTLAFNASSGAVEAGPTISGVTTVAALSADIAALADIEDGTTATDAISGLAAIKANVTTAAGIASNITSVAGNATNINSAVSNASNINTVAGSISNVNAVAAKASLITSDFVSDLNTLAVTDVINDINLLATSDIVSDLNTLATTDIVSDLNTLATTDIVSDINTLATSDIVTDLNLLATSDFVSDLNTLATSGNVTAINNVSGDIANVNTVASNLSSVNSFSDRYRVSTNAPTTSLDAGDLWFDTTNNLMKVYGASGFVNAGSSVNGTANRFAWTVGTSSGSYDGSLTVFPATYDSGFVDVFLNGVKLLVGTDVTATNGTSVTLASAAVAADIVEIVAYGTFTAATELSLIDNKKISLGTSQDLELTWDGTDGHITVAGTLNIDGSGETLAKFIDDGAVELYYNNSKKIETTDTGVLITGGSSNLLFKREDTTTIAGNPLGAIEFSHTDTDDAGTAAKILGEGDGSSGEGRIAFYTGTPSALTEKMRISSGGSVGIGTASPARALQVNSTAIPFRVVSSDSTGSIEIGDSTGSVRLGSGNSGAMRFFVGGAADFSGEAEKVRIDGDGIKFNGDTAAANGLSDYEEGTWTPSMSSSSGTAPSPSSASGTYTKIGRLVTVNAILLNITKGGTESAVIQVVSLPFTPDTQDAFGACLFGDVTFADPEVTGQAANVDASADLIRFFVSKDGAGRALIDNQHIGSGTADLYFTISYITNQ